MSKHIQTYQNKPYTDNQNKDMYQWGVAIIGRLLHVSFGLGNSAGGEANKVLPSTGSLIAASS